MAENPQENGPITYSEDIDQRDLTVEEREESDLYLDDPNAVDNLPWTPPERRPLGVEFEEFDETGTETIDQRIRQEEPEEGTAYGAPNPLGEFEETDPDRDMLGGDDADAIPAETDFQGGQL